MVDVDQPPARVCVEDRAAETRGQQAFFVDTDPGRPTGPIAMTRRNDTRIVLVPVGRPDVLVAAQIPTPVASPRVAREPMVPARHDPLGPATRIAIIIVVGLPEIAERIDRDLVRVAEVVRDRRESPTVSIDAHHETLDPCPPVVRRAPGPQREPVAIRHRVWALVAGVEPEPAVRSCNHRVETVVVVTPAEAGQQDRLLVSTIVAVEVPVADQGRGARHVDRVADHRDAERNEQVRVLDEDLRDLGDAVAVRVLEDDDALSVRVHTARIAPTTLAVVDALGHPDPVPVVDVDRSGVVELR